MRKFLTLLVTNGTVTGFVISLSNKTLLVKKGRKKNEVVIRFSKKRISSLELRHFTEKCAEFGFKNLNVVLSDDGKSYWIKGFKKADKEELTKILKFLSLNDSQIRIVLSVLGSRKNHARKIIPCLDISIKSVRNSSKSQNVFSGWTINYVDPCDIPQEDWININDVLQRTYNMLDNFIRKYKL